MNIHKLNNINILGTPLFYVMGVIALYLVVGAFFVHYIIMPWVYM